MIGTLRGVIVERNADGSVVLDVAGVGYEVFVPLGALGRLGATNDVAVLFYVHTHVRDDALQLFGFETIEDKTAFRALLGVSGIGPKLALAILGTLDAPRLATAIARGDKSAFKGISGVGKKTVERLLIDLKDKVPLVSGGRPRAVALATDPAASAGHGVVIDLLVQMGYKRPEAEHAVQKLGDRPPDAPMEQLLREALAVLA